MSALLDRYLALAKLSEQLAASARAQDWPAIQAAHGEREQLISAIGTQNLAALPPDERKTIRDILLAMRDSDDSVRAELLTWREQLGQLLQGLAPEKTHGTP